MMISIYEGRRWKANGLLLFSSTVLVGALSVFSLISVVGGAVIGLCLALCVITIDHLSSSLFDQGHLPSRRVVLLSALFYGVICGAFLEFWTGSLRALRSSELEMIMPSMAPGSFVLMSVLYFVLLNMIYCSRWTMKGVVCFKLWSRFSAVALGVGVLRSLSVTGMELDVDVVVHWGFSVLFGGLPFVSAWLMVCVWFDPAYSLSRWQKGRN